MEAEWGGGGGGISVNIYIFASINFRAFAKIGNFAWIYIRVFDIITSIWYNQIIFTKYLFSQIFEKLE